MKFAPIDLAGLLNYGVMGFGLATAILAFLLIRGQRGNKASNGLFMGFALVLAGLGLVSEWLRTPTPWYELPGAPTPCFAQTTSPRLQ